MKEVADEMHCANCGNKDPQKFAQEMLLVLPTEGPARQEPIGWVCLVCGEMVEEH
jgi:hypothetical protein